MDENQALSRRQFVGGAVAALGAIGLSPAEALLASGWERPFLSDGSARPQNGSTAGLIDLSSTESPFGPSQALIDAMSRASDASLNRHRAHAALLDAIAAHHGVGREHVLLGAGSRDILRSVGRSFLSSGKKVVAAQPSYRAVYAHASGIRADAVTVPLSPRYEQDVQGLIDGARRHRRDVGLVYVCNPDNPTGIPISASKVTTLLADLPEDLPVLIDEAYHDFVRDPGYETSILHALKGRPVIVARSFSKLHGMVSLPLGYAIAPANIIDRMRPHVSGELTAGTTRGGVAALANGEAAATARDRILAVRDRTTAELDRLGFSVIPSETNFFMVHTGRPAHEVGAAFRRRGIAVGRPFPPLLDHVRVSVGTEDEMDEFMTAFADVFSARAG